MTHANDNLFLSGDRKGWQHPDQRDGDNLFHVLLASGDEQARLERVFNVRQQDVVEYVIEDREAGDDALPHADRFRGGRGTYAERLAAVQADYALRFGPPPDRG